MQIKRDYSQSFFRKSRNRRNYKRWFISGVLFLALGFFIFQSQRANMELFWMEMQGNVPTPTALPSDLAMQGAEAYRLGNLTQAANFFERVVAQRPDNVDYLYEYGQILIDLNNPEPALAIGDHIIEIAPNDPRGFTLKSKALIWLGNSNAALPLALAGLDTDPNFAPLHAALSRAYAGEARWSDALDEGFKATELDPLSVDARRSYANALMSVTLREEATVELERALEIQPNFPPTLFELALLYLASDRDQDAIDAYQRIISVEPRNARALLRLCQAYRKVGEFDRAIGFCEDAVGYDPEYMQGFFWLGSLQYRQRNFPGALNSFQSCYNLDPTFLECEYLLGLSHYYVGQCETAWNMLQESLVVAQSRADASGAVEDIQSGLVAISSDPQCSVENVQRLRPFPSELFGNRLGNAGGT